MADLLQTGAAWLAGQLQSHAGQTVTYSRSGASVEVTATVGQSEYEASDVENYHTTIKMRDYIVNAADLVINGSAIKPQRGDQIRQVVDGETKVYEVLPPSSNSDVYENRDGREVIYRIHTKLVDTE